MTKDGLRRTNLWTYNQQNDNSISGVSINATTFTGTTGALTTVNSTTVSGTNIYAKTQITADNVLADQHQTAFTVNEGDVITTLPAEAIISGGMWVIGSAGSATAPSYVAVPLNADHALGIALADTASGSNVQILTKGLYKGCIAEATINAGVGFAVGDGAALNCVKVSAAGLTRGFAIMGAGSEEETSVYLY